MAESIPLIITMRLERGKLENFKVSVKNSLAFVQENGPQLLVEVYVDEENLRAYSFQLHDTLEFVRTHWRMSDPYIRDVMQHVTVKRLDVFGWPDDAVLEGLSRSSRTGSS